MTDMSRSEILDLYKKYLHKHKVPVYRDMGLVRKSVDEAGSFDLESEPRRKRASTIYCTA